MKKENVLQNSFTILFLKRKEEVFIQLKTSFDWEGLFCCVIIQFKTFIKKVEVKFVYQISYLPVNWVSQGNYFLPKSPKLAVFEEKTDLQKQLPQPKWQTFFKCYFCHCLYRLINNETQWMDTRNVFRNEQEWREEMQSLHLIHYKQRAEI